MPELRSSDAGAQAPISALDLARLAGQLYAESNPVRTAPPTAPVAPAAPVAPVAPRGSVPGTGAAAGPARLGAEAAAQQAPVTASKPAGLGAPWAEPDLSTVLPGAGTPPYTVPVAPRGSIPGAIPASGGGFPGVRLGQREEAPGLGLDALLAPWAAPETTRPIAPIDTAETRSRPPLSELGEVTGTGSRQARPTVNELGETAGTGSRQARPALSERVGITDGSRRARPTVIEPVEITDGSRRAQPAPEFDVQAVRADFPILAERVNGRPLIWFDNAATTQKPQAVIDRLAHFYAHENSNIHRAAHELAARATDAYEDARDAVRDFLGAARSDEVTFVRGSTEGINLVAQSWGRKNLRPGDEILITHLEHHANIVPWQIVTRETGAVLRVAPVDDAGNLLLEEFGRLLGPRTKLVAATAVANATGTVTPVEAIVAQAHRAGARVLIDGAQSVPHLAVDLRQLDPDFFVFSGHKVFGPTGIGAVYLNQRVWDETPAWQGGGNMIADVTVERSIYQAPPNKYEAGTGTIADAVGLAAALRYVNAIGIERIEAYEHGLLDYATPRLAEIPGVRLIGTADHKASVLSFLLAGHDPEDVGKALNERGIAVRAGHHCAQPILRRLGVEKTVRPSFAFYNTVDEIDVFLQAVRDLSGGVGHLRATHS